MNLLQFLKLNWRWYLENNLLDNTVPWFTREAKPSTVTDGCISPKPISKKLQNESRRCKFLKGLSNDNFLEQTNDFILFNWSHTWRWGSSQFIWSRIVVKAGIFTAGCNPIIKSLVHSQNFFLTTTETVNLLKSCQWFPVVKHLKLTLNPSLAICQSQCLHLLTASQRVIICKY